MSFVEKCALAASRDYRQHKKLEASLPLTETKAGVKN